ncbi:MAG: hypothetical protein PWP51_2252 [Clostridiales bacterium]|nr:hypothetical protein [Clostridiales bacterium]MDN5299699.1 hypothetical protein [Clostridiales bacterium]
MPKQQKSHPIYRGQLLCSVLGGGSMRTFNGCRVRHSSHNTVFLYTFVNEEKESFKSKSLTALCYFL